MFNRVNTLLIVPQLDRPSAPTAELLNGLFDLTPSAPRVAMAVSEGGSMHEVTAALGLSRETVRFYLKGLPRRPA